MQTISALLFLLELFFLVYFTIAAVYFLAFAVASHFYKEINPLQETRKYHIVVLIPSFKEDSVIVETALSAIIHISNRCSFEVLVVADSLLPNTIKRLQETGAKTLPVAFDKSTKSKSINKALEIIPDTCDYILLLDADNQMAEGFLDHIVEKLEQGFRVVQGHRTALNSNTSFAFLDGLSEEVNNAIFRKGHRVLGFSASLIGSGFACEYQLFKELMGEIKAVGGFDKELELALIKRNIKIGYANQAIVFDEKIQQSAAFVNQRRRWLSAQLIYFNRNVWDGFRQLLKHGNIDYFDKVMQFMLPPRIITLGVTFVFAILHLGLSWFGHHPLSLFPASWTGLFITATMAVLLSVPAEKFSMGLIKSLLALPKGFLLTLLALLKIRGANKKFIHTQHGINNQNNKN
jgi:cellulose synthase/poly-beta-1,6-N-acetylglucosamine synthase-like glycosyltransferase